ncbi:hypothetical protein DPSP01_009048 [Paraphaeosphaeria sporulosa]|uniref:C2H2 type zinc finger domain-containing protein n=1 Tax=Paraphaeosphaeria sporulosa TaxID=1460663 RepID=A0A177CAJ2_9PLEO|nr:C2H2 type zinc finger domain-containing protein [Paraphaeosphaeria sporulosa]OAG03862.1 C2H2 type zinc finger domain-containing protein [Paraphaeosphaeria sporulosa]
MGDTASASTDIADAQALLSLCDDAYQQRRVPAFFDQIMVPEHDFVGADPALPAPDLTMWLPDTDWVGEIDLFNNDFGLSIGQTFESQQILDNFFAPAAPTETPDRTSRSRAATERGDEARRRSAIFEQSPWLWVPTRNQHAFSEHDGVTIDEQHIDIATSPHEPCSSIIAISDSLSQGARDRIFQLVSKTSASRIIIPSFPSADCLDKLIKVGIAKRMETDAWIHPYTFDSESSRLELLVALIAAGCICFGLPSVNRTGLVLQEIVRVALQNLTERDNSAFRDLQYLQASMIWLDIGAFCGYQRKMEIAESNLLQLVTAMRRAGRYDKVAYSSILPNIDDNADENERKWREWVQFESYKRLACHLFEHDMDMAMVKHRNPLHSYSEMSFPLPFSRSLWLAPSAEVWRSRMLSMSTIGGLPSLHGMLKDEDPITYLSPAVDSQVARSVYLHGVAAQIWEHSKQCALIHEDCDPSLQLWLRSRHQKIYNLLQRFSLPGDSTFAYTRTLHAFLQMYLHTSVDTITRFAGKCGEEEANRAYTLLQPWSQTKDARIAIYHAGQVLRAAREVPNHQLRGQDALMTHHSIMVLWTYSMMMSDRARRTGGNTPVRPAPSDASHGPKVFLDVHPSVNSDHVDAFIHKDVGKPCLTTIPSTTQDTLRGISSTEQVCDLRSPSQIMEIGVELLDAKHPEVERKIKPPLLRALCNLMEGLGRLR